jgi:hypothetical protein
MRKAPKMMNTAPVGRGWLTGRNLRLNGGKLQLVVNGVFIPEKGTSKRHCTIVQIPMVIMLIPMKKPIRAIETPVLENTNF